LVTFWWRTWKDETTDKLRNENHLQRNTYEEVWDNRLTVFCRVLGDGDFLSFRMAVDNSYEILDCYHDEEPQDWRVISNSFNDFAESLLNEKGKRFWL
jgi:hypothetical protein